MSTREGRLFVIRNIEIDEKQHGKSDRLLEKKRSRANWFWANKYQNSFAK